MLMASEEAEMAAILSDRVVIRSSMLWKSDFIYKGNTRVRSIQNTESLQSTQRIYREYTRVYREYTMTNAVSCGHLSMQY